MTVSLAEHGQLIFYLRAVFKSLGLKTYEFQRWKHPEDVSFTIASHRPTCPGGGTGNSMCLPI
jgi:hypothetical protein